MTPSFAADEKHRCNQGHQQYNNKATSPFALFILTLLETMRVLSNTSPQLSAKYYNTYRVSMNK